MNELEMANRAADWHRLKALVLDSVSSPITRRVYHLGLDEFIAWYGQEARAGFTKATVSAWRVTLEARGLGSVSINVRITAVRKLAVEAADNGLLAPELAAGPAGRWPTCRFSKREDSALYRSTEKSRCHRWRWWKTMKSSNWNWSRCPGSWQRDGGHDAPRVL
jgi:hypothetical protein